MSFHRTPQRGECWRLKEGARPWAGASHVWIVAVWHSTPSSVDYCWHELTDVTASEPLEVVLEDFEPCAEHARKRGGEA